MMKDEKADEMISNLTGAGNRDASEKLDLGVADVGDSEEPEPQEAEPTGSGETEPEPAGEAVQAGEEGEGAEGGDPEAAEPQLVTKEEYDELHREAVKRRHTEKELKQRLKAQEENIGAMWQTVQQTLAEKQASEIPPEEREMLNDPVVRTIRGDIQQLREDAGLTPEQMAYKRQQQAAVAAAQAAEEELVGYIDTARTKFVETHPDYTEAVEHSVIKRSRQLVRQGMSEEDAGAQVQREMLDMCARAYDLGRNPAQLAYETAVEDWGWTPKNGDEPAPAEPKGPYIDPRPRTMDSVSRIKAGLQSQSVADMSGDRGGTDSEINRATMTREQFYTQVDPATRIQVMANQAKFEELAKTGRITVDWV